jgi:endonuclease/exonuclease/phosphatase family metal-dependent hydrolase
VKNAGRVRIYFRLSVLYLNNDFLEYETLLLGDFNTDVSSDKSYPLLKCFKSFIHMFHFNQLISEPTRICSTSSTTIDLILVSDHDKISQSGVISTSFSDHNMIYCTRKLSKSFIGSHNNVTLRSL